MKQENSIDSAFAAQAALIASTMGVPAPLCQAKRGEVVELVPLSEEKHPLPDCGASEPAVALIAMLVRPGAKAVA